MLVTDPTLLREQRGSPSNSAVKLKRVRSIDEIHTAIATAQKLYESQGRPKAKDYDDVTQEILAIAIAIYRCLICTNTPFPDHVKELEFVRIAWKIACRKLDIQLEMTPELVKMVSAHCLHRS
jgi:hypothetical protein